MLGGAFTRTTAQTETNRTARITIPITSVAVGQTQTKVLLELYSSATDIIEGKFIINHPFTPNITHTGPYTVAMPLLHKEYCKPFGEVCFGTNDTFAEAPEIKLESLINQTFNGTLNLPNDQRDYFRVTITDTRPYTVSINALAPTTALSDLDLYLYDTQQKVVCRSSFVGTSNERISINVKPCSSSAVFTQTTVLPGTYTLMVQYAFTGTIANSTVPYTLTINR